EERSFLSEGRLFLAPPVRETATCLDQLEQVLQALRDAVYAGASGAIDLQFLVLESQLAPLAGHSRNASGDPTKASGRGTRLLLARVLAHYAEWLSWQTRRREAFRTADRAVEILQEDGPPSPTARALPLAVH